MLKIILLLLIFPSLSFATSCATLPQLSLPFALLSERHETIAFKVLGINQYSVNSVDVEVTHRFGKSTIDSDLITITRGELSASYPLVSGFTIGSEWLSVIGTSDNYYYFSICRQSLQIQNGIVSGTTGLDSLDTLTMGFSIEQLDLAINSYQQGLQAANLVCQSDNSYCDKVKTTYDKHTGVLNLPSVEYEIFGHPAYLKAKMQLSNDGSGNFTITELQGYHNN